MMQWLAFLLHIQGPLSWKLKPDHLESLYKAYSEINVRWASVGSPVKMATWHWRSTKR